MARALIASTCLVGCLHADGPSPERAVATWREMQAGPPGAAAPDASKAVKYGEPLTAEQAYALALAGSPELAVAEARADVAAAGVAASRQLENPELRLTNFHVDDGARGGPALNLGLRAPIPRPGSVRARVEGARLAAEGAQGDADAARRRLRARVFRLFARLALLAADLEEVTRAAALCEERRRQIGVRVDRAVATEVELALAEVELAEALDEAGRVRGELARTEAELDRVVGPGPARRFRVDPSALHVADIDLDAAALTERALRERPELRAVQARVGQAQASVRLARVQALPWPSWAQVNYYAGRNATSALGFGLAVDLPLFSLNRGEIRAARALVRQRELEERAAVAALAGEVGEALARARQADARVRELEQGLLPQVDAAARQADAALAAGALDVVEVLDIEARRIAARRLHLAALYERRDAIIELEAAVGAPLDR